MRIRGRRIVKTPPSPTSSVGSSEDPPAQQEEQEVLSLPFNGAIFLPYQRNLHDQSIKEDTAGGVTEDAYKEINDSHVTPRRGKVLNAAVPAQQVLIVVSSDEDEPALRSTKVDPDEVTSRRIRKRIDIRDVNMGRSNRARNKLTQVGHARVRASGVARARGVHNIMHNLMPSCPKSEEELVKNVYGEAKKVQRKRFRLLREFYGV
ncbi:uncharacterized protein LOC103963793 [Pyrus x bretschneideri]|uniref:uncharacterized protein LOC103963793 n=1 Tax=Pyrus x bretschneideri TaxID=225117 RepID=UPI002030D31E|nr:uncharacterized protein LOC103963793 [Pyrus x bretschneideri]